MFPVMLLYAAAGALLSAGVFGGKHVYDIAGDEATKDRLRRRMQNEQQLIDEAVKTKTVQDEALRQGVDLDSLMSEVSQSRDAQERLTSIITTALARLGFDPAEVRSALQP